MHPERQQWQQSSARKIKAVIKNAQRQTRVLSQSQLTNDQRNHKYLDYFVQALNDGPFTQR